MYICTFKNGNLPVVCSLWSLSSVSELNGERLIFKGVVHPRRVAVVSQ